MTNWSSTVLQLKYICPGWTSSDEYPVTHYLHNSSWSLNITIFLCQSAIYVHSGFLRKLSAAKLCSVLTIYLRQHRMCSRLITLSGLEARKGFDYALLELIILITAYKSTVYFKNTNGIKIEQARPTLNKALSYMKWQHIPYCHSFLYCYCHRMSIPHLLVIPYK